MKSLTRSNQMRRNRDGLTLIELVLVLVVLIALAGILAPIFGNVVGLSHGSSGAANIAQTVSALENHRGM